MGMPKSPKDMKDFTEEKKTNVEKQTYKDLNRMAFITLILS